VFSKGLGEAEEGLLLRDDGSYKLREGERERRRGEAKLLTKQCIVCLRRRNNSRTLT
jgi:hypothetical protein